MKDFYFGNVFTDEIIIIIKKHTITLKNKNNKHMKKWGGKG